ncbi:hypothetical protein C1Y40_04514 [Mycobacterium talmoniae]|uniref:Uncharacterized protein n=1 Tax=Mycobacterium talmoniae TaxID=1858794 RepID=A0A2S8BFB4_9MYCO|nr:hypothetical protein C1Y40_04514 [Mycobacterium talmoniae]
MRPNRHVDSFLGVLYVERNDHIDVLRVLHQRRDIPELLRDLGQDE